LTEPSAIGDHCTHCGASRAADLGRCDVCGMSVCTRCGNTQHKGGGKTAVHDSCLPHIGDSGFSMMKFVK
jgi:hypothetical protein